MQAKARLTKILTQAVGIVDRPANGRPFLVLKSEVGVGEESAGMDQGAGGATPVADAAPAGPATPPAVDAAKPLAMPGAVKDELAQGLSSALECLSKIAECVGSATVDDTASVPVDLLMKLDAVADQLDALADKWAFDGGPSAMGEATLAAPEGDAMKAAPKEAPTPGRKMRLLAKKRMAVMEDAHKAISEGHAATAGGIEKMHGLMKELAGELPDTGKGKPVGGNGEPKAPEKKTPPPGDGNDAPNGGAVEKTAKSVTDAVTAALAPLLESQKSLQERLARVESRGQLPNAAVVEEASSGAVPKSKTFRQMLADAKR